METVAGAVYREIVPLVTREPAAHGLQFNSERTTHASKCVVGDVLGLSVRVRRSRDPRVCALECTRLPVDSERVCHARLGSDVPVRLNREDRGLG